MAAAQGASGAALAPTAPSSPQRGPLGIGRALPSASRPAFSAPPSPPKLPLRCRHDSRKHPRFLSGAQRDSAAAAKQRRMRSWS